MTKAKKQHLILKLQNMKDIMSRDNVKIIFGDYESNKQHGGYLTIAYIESIQNEIKNTIK